MTSTSNAVCALMKILSRVSPKKKDRKAKGFQISDFNWLFSSDIMTVKGLNQNLLSGRSVMFNLQATVWGNTSFTFQGNIETWDVIVCVCGGGGGGGGGL